ncbi:MAG TPA: hypothetical protein VER17_06525 [Tepidisphaeraceae bacterium]|nr:hypothetical protein [Tepidisphaeraceae bacterium]
MWFAQDSKSNWGEAVRFLRAAHPGMRRAIDLVGPCTLAPRRDYFVVLCKSIYSQQISTAAAASLFGRFRDLFPSRRPTPRLVLQVLDGDPEALRGVGLSRQKQAYVRDLAEHFATNRIPTRRLATMGDEEVIDALVRVNGIGRWTAEMFLIFTLNRPDVWPVDDLGLRKGAQIVLGLEEMPAAKALVPMGDIFRPWRSIATWYLWRGMEKVGQPRAHDRAARPPPRRRARRA